MVYRSGCRLLGAARAPVRSRRRRCFPQDQANGGYRPEQCTVMDPGVLRCRLRFKVRQPRVSHTRSPTGGITTRHSLTGTVSVTTQTGCTWTDNSDASWLIITSNSTGTGNGTVNYSVSANSGTGSQSGTMTIAGKTFTVNQSGRPRWHGWGYQWSW